MLWLTHSEMCGEERSHADETQLLFVHTVASAGKSHKVEVSGVAQDSKMTIQYIA